MFLSFRYVFLSSRDLLRKLRHLLRGCIFLCKGHCLSGSSLTSVVSLLCAISVFFTEIIGQVLFLTGLSNLDCAADRKEKLGSFLMRACSHTKLEKVENGGKVALQSTLYLDACEIHLSCRE